MFLFFKALSSCRTCSRNCFAARDKLCDPSATNSLNLIIIENYVGIVVTVASPVPSSNRIYVGVVAEKLPALRLLRPLMSLLSGVPGKETSTCTWRSCASSSCSSSPVNTGGATVIEKPKKKKTINDSHENVAVDALLRSPPYEGHSLSGETPVSFLIRKPRKCNQAINTDNGHFLYPSLDNYFTILSR